MALRSLGRSPATVTGPAAPPPPLWERASAASLGPSTYLLGRLNSILLYYSVQHQNAQGRTRAGAGAMMHVIRRAGGMSRVLLARALYIKVCPAFGMVRVGSGLASFRADQGELARIAGRPALRRSGFSRNSGTSFPGSSFVHSVQFNRVDLCRYTKCSTYVKSC